MKKQKTNNFSLISRIRSFGFAFQGIFSAYQSGHNLWIQSFVGMLVILAGIWLEVSKTEWLILIICIGMVLSAEIFNSSIEKLVDLVSPDYNKKAGRIKDLAAGAVLMLSITAAVIGLLIFIPRLINLL
jgi:diacylglycerol kinase (ATP)